jgi:hypothetical protein
MNCGRVWQFRLVLRELELRADFGKTPHKVMHAGIIDTLLSYWLSSRETTGIKGVIKGVTIEIRRDTMEDISAVSTGV